MTCQSRNAADHHGVDGGEGPPPGRDQAAHPPAVELVEAPQREQRDDGRHDGQHHRRQLQRGGLGGEPGVDGGRQRKPLWRSAGQVGEHADDRRPQVRVGEPGALRVDRRRCALRRARRTSANVPASVEVISMR